MDESYLYLIPEMKLQSFIFFFYTLHVHATYLSF